jgi:hypothetical protein
MWIFAICIVHVDGWQPVAISSLKKAMCRLLVGTVRRYFRTGIGPTPSVICLGFRPGQPTSSSLAVSYRCQLRRANIILDFKTCLFSSHCSDGEAMHDQESTVTLEMVSRAEGRYMRTLTQAARDVKTAPRCKRSGRVSRIVE